MKIITFLMAIMVFVLSCIPCMDAPFAQTIGKPTIEKSSSQNQQHKEADPCSPFCTCNCCAGFAFSPSLIKVQPIMQVVIKEYCSYLSSSAIEISLPVWQPPQIA